MARTKKNQVSKRVSKGRQIPNKKPIKNSTSSGTGLIIGTVLAALLIAGVVFFLRTPAANTTVQSFDLTNQPILGQGNAPVTMVLVSDFKCPACRAFEQGVLPQLISNYTGGGKLKIASLTWPFLAKAQNLRTDDSMLAAQAAECVYNQQSSAGYYAYSSVLFGNQEDERRVWATKAKLKALAGGLDKLDQTKFAQCLDSNATKAAVQADEQQVRAAGVTGTPTVFINGQVTPATFADISAAINAAGQ